MAKPEPLNLAATQSQEEAKAAQEELSRRIATRTHVPNPVPVLATSVAAAAKTRKLKVIEVYSNGTFKVEDGGKALIVSIPINRVPRPVAGDTVGIVFDGGDVVKMAKPDKVEGKPV